MEAVIEEEYDSQRWRNWKDRRRNWKDRRRTRRWNSHRNQRNKNCTCGSHQQCQSCLENKDCHSGKYPFSFTSPILPPRFLISHSLLSLVNLFSFPWTCLSRPSCCSLQSPARSLLLPQAFSRVPVYPDVSFSLWCFLWRRLMKFFDNTRVASSPSWNLKRFWLLQGVVISWASQIL